jgi:CBS domain containing-hemolysin-like protein
VAENTAFIVIALLLVLLNGFFVASEFAIVKIRSTRVEELKKIHGWRGGVLAAVHRKLDAYLSACQLGITLASLGLGWVGEPAFAKLLEGPAEWMGLDDDPNKVEAAAFIFAFTTISFLHIVVGELAPKSMAIRRPEAVSLWTAVPLWAFYWAMYPFIWILNLSANGVLRIMGLGHLGEHAHEAPYSREELRSILHISRPASEGPEHAISSMVSHALELPDLHVSDLMRPPREMIAIQRASRHDEVWRLLKEHYYSRYPVRVGEGEVQGVLHIKDILAEDPGPDYSERLMKRLHQPLWVSEDDSVATLLRRFQEGMSHFAVATDADGRMAGFLTLEDVLEAIFGEITDEHERLRKSQVRREPRWDAYGNLVARGDTALFRIERELGRKVEASDDVGTLAGLLMHKLDRIAVTGDSVEHDGLRLDVLKAQGPRAHWIRIGSSDPNKPLSRSQNSLAAQRRPT